jgi:hypothetical protein
MTAIANAVGRYRRLSPPARRALWAALAAEAVLIALTERDIHRRPAERIRGPKPLWRIFATQNFVGPAAYYALGRRSGR